MIIKISQAQYQKQIMSQAMQYSMEVLQLPLLELNQEINQEVLENPLLEISEEERIKKSIEDEILDRLSKSPLNNTPSYNERNFDDERIEHQPIEEKQPLENDLGRQVRLEFDSPLQIAIGEFIIGNLDEDGYLQITTDEIADFFEINDFELIEDVIFRIQNFDPIGIASRNLKECLSRQIPSKCNGKSELITKIVTEHLEALGKKKFKDIAKNLKISIDEVKNALLIIASLEPKPARNYRPLKASLYIKPDIYITKNENEEHQIHINKEGIPALRINNIYRKMLYQQGLKKEEKEFIREKLKGAIHFIKCIEQRGVTIRKIAEYILEKQKDFFKYGPQHLVPLKLKDVAEALERNESTISRAVTNKYVETPKGLYPLKFFFSQGIPSNGKNGGIASRSIKEELKDLIQHENPSSPLSDKDIQNHFEKKQYKIARRTITKYRKSLHILPSYLRKQ